MGSGGGGGGKRRISHLPGFQRSEKIGGLEKQDNPPCVDGVSMTLNKLGHYNTQN